MTNFNNGTKKIIILMIFIVISGLTIAYFYYDNLNKNVDPRLIEVQEVLAHFDNINKLDSSFYAIELMDSLETKLKNIDLYKNSYELGVVKNNRASVYIMMAIYNDEFNNMKDSLFSMSLSDLFTAEKIFKKWINDNKNIEDNKLTLNLKNEYIKDSVFFKGLDIDKVISHRIKDLNLAKIETPRRLSVVYSNIAVIMRHTNKLENAIKYNKKAIELWPKNHEAKNNLKVLMGQKPEKRNVFEKIFPSKRDE